MQHSLQTPTFDVRLPCGDVEGQDDAVPTMEEIVAAARQRQEAVTSGEFEWTADRWLKKGSRTILGGRLGNSNQPDPPEDLEISAERTLLFSGESVRYETFGPQRNPAMDVYTPFRLLTTWNGKKSCMFQDPEGFWNGRIYNRAWFQHIRDFDPISWTYRPFDANWTRFDINEFSVRPALEEAGGEPCVLLETSKPNRARPDLPLVQRIWLSRDRQFVVRRFETGRGATVSTRIDIEYEESSQGFPVPIRWSKVEDVNIDPPRSIEQCEVVHYELNVPIDAENFQFTFPANTWVEEEGVEKSYIVREDGSHRPITDAELNRGAQYEDLLTTPSGQAKLTPPKSNPYVWVFWTVQALLAVGILVYLYRTRWAHNGS